MADRKPPAHMPTAVRAHEQPPPEEPAGEAPTTSEELKVLNRMKTKPLVELTRKGAPGVTAELMIAGFVLVAVFRAWLLK